MSTAAAPCRHCRRIYGKEHHSKTCPITKRHGRWRWPEKKPRPLSIEDLVAGPLKTVRINE